MDGTDAKDAEIQRLREQVQELRRQLTGQRAQNHRRNLELDALHYVWCSGGCPSGVDRYDEDNPVSPQVVAAAIHNTRRLAGWWINHRHRVTNYSPTEEEQRQFWAWREELKALMDAAALKDAATEDGSRAGI